MTEGEAGRAWLVVDAAGPVSVVGISVNGSWRVLHPAGGPSMENLHERVRQSLRESDLSLEGLEGVWYAEGPGSTLGLRLAALFLQVLGLKRSLAHWSVRVYNNLEVTAAQLDLIRTPARSLYAPWKKGFYHRARAGSGQESRIALDTCGDDDRDVPNPLFVRLGLRTASIPQGATEIPYPFEQIPALLTLHPSLLREVKTLKPYSPAPPEFARWEGRRHSAP